MTTWRYRFAGVLFESVFQLPEWSAFAVADAVGTPDARILLDGSLDTATADGDYRFSIPGVARYRIHGGERIVVAPVSEASEDEVRLFLLGSALAALCTQRGLLVLHASVVQLAGRTVALCGSTGSGKSSLAAALVDRGASLVCDDLGRFETSGGCATVYPSIPRMKLSPEALEALQWPADRFARVHPRAIKFHVPQAHLDPWSPVPLHAIYVLEWTDRPAAVTRLAGRQALVSLVGAATYRPAMLEAMGRLAAHWEQCAALAAAAPVYRLTRPRAWSAMDEAIDAISLLR